MSLSVFIHHMMEEGTLVPYCTIRTSIIELMRPTRRQEEMEMKDYEA